MTDTFAGGSNQPPKRAPQPELKIRVFGVLGNKQIVIDPDWARPQEDLDRWLAGDA